MGDVGEYFRENKEFFKAKRERRYKRNVQFVLNVKDFERKEVTPYQHRFSHPEVGEFCDLYPTNQRYHNIITGERGTYKTAQGYLKIQLEKTIAFREQSDEANR